MNRVTSSASATLSFPNTSNYLHKSFKILLITVSSLCLGLSLLAGWQILVSFFFAAPSNIQDGFVPWAWFGTLGTAVLCIAVLSTLSMIGLVKKSVWGWRLALICSILNISLILAFDYIGLFLGLAMLFYIHSEDAKQFSRVCFKTRSKYTIGTGKLSRQIFLASILILSLLVFSSASSAFSPGFVNLYGTRSNTSTSDTNYPLANFSDVPSFSTGWKQLRLWRIGLAYRFNGIIPEFKLEPFVSVKLQHLDRSLSIPVNTDNSTSTSINKLSSTDATPPVAVTPSEAPQYSVNVPLATQIPSVHGQGGGIVYDPANGDILIGATALYDWTNYTCACDNGYTAINDVTNVAVGYYLVNSTNCGVTGSMVYDTHNDNVYTIDQSCGYVYKIDGVTNAYLGNISVGGGQLGDIAYDSGNGYLYVSNAMSSSINVVNPSSGQVVANISTGGLSPTYLTYDSQNGNVYVVTANPSYGDVAVIDGESNTWIANVSASNSMNDGIAYDPVNGLLYAFSYAANAFYLINGSSNSVVGNITDTSGSAIYDSMVYDQGNGEIYALNTEGNDTLVIDATTNSIVGDITVCSNQDGSRCSPGAAAYDPWSGNLYVAEDYSCGVCGSGNTTVIPTVAAKLPIGLNFTETGLPSYGVNEVIPWNVTLNSAVTNGPVHSGDFSSETQVMAVVVPGGNMYNYSITEVKGCKQICAPAYLPRPNADQRYLPSSGNWSTGQTAYIVGSVNNTGLGANIPVLFVPLWSLTFSPGPASGSMTVQVDNCSNADAPGGTTISCSTSTAAIESSSTSVVFYELDGTYSFNVRSGSYLPIPSKGTIMIDGHDVAITLSFIRLSVGQGIILADGDIWVANKTNVGVFNAGDLSSQGVIPLGGDVVSLASGSIGSSSIIYAVNRGTDSLQMLDAATGALLKNISLDSGPLGIAVDQIDSSHSIVAVTNFYSNDVSMLSISGSSSGVSVIKQNMPLLDSPTGVAYDPQNNQFYVSLFNSADIISVPASNANPGVSGAVAVGSGPMGIDYNGGTLFVADSGSSSISEVAGGGSLVTNVQTDFRFPIGMAVDSTDSIFVVYGSASPISVMHVQYSNRLATLANVVEG
ncbi:MAG: hypothetical protein JRN20_21975, partial [Nitrososphaerota archaeon]|nr:hypothetical protein [Nitrososphaerota archaeon]